MVVLVPPFPVAEDAARPHTLTDAISAARARQAVSPVGDIDAPAVEPDDDAAWLDEVFGGHDAPTIPDEPTTLSSARKSRGKGNPRVALEAGRRLDADPRFRGPDGLTPTTRDLIQLAVRTWMNDRGEFWTSRRRMARYFKGRPDLAGAALRNAKGEIRERFAEAERAGILRRVAVFTDDGRQDTNTYALAARGRGEI